MVIPPQLKLIIASQGNSVTHKMIYRTIILLILSLHLPSHIFATELQDTLIKTFKSRFLPYSGKVARIIVKTPIKYKYSNSKERTVIHTASVHDKIMHSLKQNGWKDNDPLLIDYIEGGILGIETTESSNVGSNRKLYLRFYLNMCDTTRKYRGEDINAFLNKVIEKMEYCITYENDLQGRNYPY